MLILALWSMATSLTPGPLTFTLFASIRGLLGEDETEGEKFSILELGLNLWNVASVTSTAVVFLKFEFLSEKKLF